MPASPESFTADADVSIWSIADQAATAVQEAYARTREAGLPVVVAEGDELVQIDADGHRTVLKQLPPQQAPSRPVLLIR